MLHARPDYQRIQDPARTIPQDEPVFLIRGQDVLGAEMVRAYAERAELAGMPRDLIESARRHADAMDAWPTKKTPDL